MNLHLPSGYVSNPNPSPCNDDAGGPEWQVGVYDIAKSFGLPIVDIGCGRARKLQGYAPGFVGVDRAETVAWLREHRPEGEWVAADLDKHWPSIDTAGCTIVCSDVIEHLVNTLPLLTWLANQQATIVLSTPDRVKWRGPEHNGPPPNTEHVREWSFSEFSRLVAEVFGDRETRVMHTASFEGGPDNTITVVVKWQ